MRSDNIKTYNPQFSSIYRIKHVTQRENTVFNAGIKPITTYFFNMPIILTQGKNPFEPALIKYACDIADNMNSNFNWIMQNANMHGKNLPNPKDMEAWVATGYDDITHLYKFIKKFPIAGGFRDFIKCLFSKKSSSTYNKVPSHLRRLFLHIDQIENANTDFEKHMAKQGKIIECKDFNDFLEKFNPNE